VLRVVRGDITKLPVEAVVNAANSQLVVGGGVDHAIHRAAGPELKEHLASMTSNLPVGQTLLTPGFGLPAKSIIHTVAPMWRDGTSDELIALASCYRNVIETARENQISSLAIPSLGTGAFGIPALLAARTAINTLLSLELDRLGLDVILCTFSEEDYLIYGQALSQSDSTQLEGNREVSIEDCPICFWPAHILEPGRKPDASWPEAIFLSSVLEPNQRSLKCSNCGWMATENSSPRFKEATFKFLCHTATRGPLFAFDYRAGLPVPMSVKGPTGTEVSFSDEWLFGFLNPANYEKPGDIWIAEESLLTGLGLERILANGLPVTSEVLKFLGFRQLSRKPRFRAWV
jgi:O-acetyl-ADP-ribose deacetylase (regulator of RNase III)